MKIEEIPTNEVFTINPTNMEILISGAYKAGFKHDGTVTLCYINGERETYKFPIEDAQNILDKGMENFFSVVSSIQSKRQIEYKYNEEK